MACGSCGGRGGVLEDGDNGAEDYRARLETRLGYGLFLPGYAGVFTPYTGMTLGATEGFCRVRDWATLYRAVATRPCFELPAPDTS